MTLGDPAYLAVNPAGAVPALDTGEGWILTQAGAVLLYLARRFPQAQLGPGERVAGAGGVRTLVAFSHRRPASGVFPGVLAAALYGGALEDAALDDVKEAARALIVKKSSCSTPISPGRRISSAKGAPRSTPMPFRCCAGR